MAQQSPTTDTMRLLLGALDERYGGVARLAPTPRAGPRADTDRMRRKLLGPDQRRLPTSRRQPAVTDAGCTAGSYFFLPLSPSLESAAMKASWGTSTRPTIFIRFLPSFCFSSSLRLRVMSPP